MHYVYSRIAIGGVEQVGLGPDHQQAGPGASAIRAEGAYNRVNGIHDMETIVVARYRVVVEVALDDRF